MRPPGARYRRVTLGLLAAAIAAPGDAASIELSVRRRDGTPVAHQRFLVRPPEPSEILLPRRGETDDAGHARIDGLAAGRYTLKLLPPLRDGSLLLPEENPKEPLAPIALVDDGAIAAVAVVLWPGIPLRLHLAVDTPVVPPARILLREVDTGATAVAEIDETGYALSLLPAGRWEARWDPIPGYILTDIVRNGDPIDIDRTIVDLTDPLLRSDVTFTISARTNLSGTVTLNGKCVGGVIATLLEPGPWHPAAIRRGGSIFTPLEAFVDRYTCRYELVLPDGLWRLIPRPEGGGIVAAPELLELALTPGASAHADFTLTVPEGDGFGEGRDVGWIYVEPVFADGSEAVGAVVDVWPLDAAARGTNPLASAVREKRRPVLFRGLAAGAYLIVAGHVDGLEGESELGSYKPGGGPAKEVKVVMKRGGAADIAVRDKAGEPVGGVAITLTRLAGEPSHPLRGEPLDARKRERVATTDPGGHVVFTGLDPGRWRVRGGSAKPGVWVRLRDDHGALENAVEVEVAAEGTTKLEGVAGPAPALSGTLRCLEPFQLPSVVAVRVVPSDAVAAGEDPFASAVLARDDVPLQDGAFTVGPIAAGAYRVAVRPAGFDWWTWYPGIEDAAHADPVSVSGDSVDAVNMDLACGPLVVARPRVASGEILPDLRKGGRVVVRALDATRVERKLEPAPSIEIREGETHIRGIAEGKPILQVTVHHPYFVPEGAATVEATVTLARFHAIVLQPVVARIGGAVRAHLASVAARLVVIGGDGREGATVVARVADGVASFDGVVPGVYRVDACAEASCAKATLAFADVRVTARAEKVLQAEAGSARR